MNISKFSRKVCFLSCSNIVEYHVSETNMYLPVSGAFIDTSLTFKTYCNQCLNHTGSMMVFFPSSLRLQAEPLSNKSCVTCAESWINMDQQVHNPFSNNSSNSLANHSWSTFEVETEATSLLSGEVVEADEKTQIFTFNPATEKKQRSQTEARSHCQLVSQLFPAHHLVGCSTSRCPQAIATWRAVKPSAVTALSRAMVTIQRGHTSLEWTVALDLIISMNLWHGMAYKNYRMHVYIYIYKFINIHIMYNTWIYIYIYYNYI